VFRIDDKRVFLSDLGTVLLNPGSHNVEVSAEGFETQRRRVTLTSGVVRTESFPMVPVPEQAGPEETAPVEEAPVETAPMSETTADEPTEQPMSRSKKFWISGIAVSGVGVATLVAGSICGGLALAKNNEVNQKCQDGVCEPQYADLVDSRDHVVLSSTVLWAVGGTITAGGIALMIVAKLSKNREENSNIAILPTIGGLTMIGEF
jgi:hypothetical protein